ncbi:MAG TPA: D-alanyl-lipoteichoic acid biosynthesis protein DltD, partial [Anaerolineales bacterium]
MNTRPVDSSVARSAGEPETLTDPQEAARSLLLAYPHLAPALAALALVVALLAGSLLYSRWLEQRDIHAVAPLLLSQANLGSALQMEALRQPDLLLVYGSSELIDLPSPQRAFQFFQSYPTGFTVFTVAKAGATSLD